MNKKVNQEEYIKRMEEDEPRVCDIITDAIELETAFKKICNYRQDCEYCPVHFSKIKTMYPEECGYKFMLMPYKDIHNKLKQLGIV